MSPFYGLVVQVGKHLQGEAWRQAGCGSDACDGRWCGCDGACLGRVAARLLREVAGLSGLTEQVSTALVDTHRARECTTQAGSSLTRRWRSRTAATARSASAAANVTGSPAGVAASNRSARPVSCSNCRRSTGSAVVMVCPSVRGERSERVARIWQLILLDHQMCALTCGNDGGRYWDRTSDLFGVNEALSR